MWRDRWVAAAASNRFNSTMTCMILALSTGSARMRGSVVSGIDRRDAAPTS